jgi:hypothetical protein
MIYLLDVRRWGPLVALLLLAASQSVAADALVMPRDLTEYANSLQCKPILNFYDRRGMIEPPYVYGVVPGEKEKSAALWCESATRGDKPYALLFKISEGRDIEGCPLRIDWWNPTGGLSIEHRRRTSLKQYRYVKEPEKLGPDLVLDRATVVLSYYDGVSTDFVCHQGSWFFRISE